MSVLLVCGNSFDKSLVKYEHVFSGFSANPTYEQVMEGVEIFLNTNTTEIIACGGGSAIDTAKAIKYYANSLDTPLTAIPTTAGSGSEATDFAVIYKNGQKISLEHTSLLPDKVVFKPQLLSTLPLYLKQASLLDAWAQAIESLWSKNATSQSKAYANEAIETIEKNHKAYLNNEQDSYEHILKAANLAGKAICITKTTAPHAMSYKITTMFGIAHGHAVALTLAKVHQAMGLKDEHISAKVNNFDNAFKAMGLPKPDIYDILTKEVNVQRLKNSPHILTEAQIYNIYKEVLSQWM